MELIKFFRDWRTAGCIPYGSKPRGRIGGWHVQARCLAQPFWLRLCPLMPSRPPMPVRFVEPAFRLSFALSPTALAGPTRSSTTEAVVVDQRGVTDFELHSALAGRAGSREVFLFAFDLLALDGEDMRPHPWGKSGVRPWLGSCARRAPAFGSPNISTARTARPCSSTPAEWALKASWRSESTGLIAPGARPIGSRSRTRTRRQRPG